jgi:hypothetical protein
VSHLSSQQRVKQVTKNMVDALNTLQVVKDLVEKLTYEKSEHLWTTEECLILARLRRAVGLKEIECGVFTVTKPT